MTKEIGKEFMLKTRYKYLGQSGQSKGLPQPSLELDYNNERVVVALPDYRDFKAADISVRDAIEKRRSIRKYSSGTMSLEELSYLLWCTQGVKEVIPGKVTFRNVPSAGARHAFETILLINNVSGIQNGLYKYCALEHRLVELNVERHMDDRVVDACLGQDFIKTCCATFIWVAVANRMKWRYGERGYRYLHLDAGHVCQNLYLAAETIGCGVCAVAAFDDDSISECLDIDGEEQFVIYIGTVGKK